MNRAILNPEVQKYINDHLNNDITRILLSKSPFKDVSSKELAEQIDSKKRSEKKLPSWFNTEGIYYPPKLSVEQSSSEATAEYKSNLALKGNMIDISAGFGVDSYYFSKKVKDIISCEQNKELSEIAKHNSIVLDANNIQCINSDSLSYLENTNETFHTIFIDPARRAKTGKVFMLKDCEPDITSHISLLLSKAERIIIKTSPLLDIQSGLKELLHVSEIHVISIKNDCKELLWVIDREFNAEPEINCAAISEAEIQKFSFKQSAEKALELQSWSTPLDYLYEPDAALLKAGCFKLIADRYNLKKLNPNTHLYTSSEQTHSFIGRTFKVLNVMDYKSFINSKTVKKANIISRNFPLSPIELKKRHKLEDGGEDYLLFARGQGEELLTIHAKRL